MEPLDNPVWHALQGPNRTFARTNGRAARYDPEVSPFAALPDSPGPRAWTELAALLGPGEPAILAGPGREPPSTWETSIRLSGVQMVAPPAGSHAPRDVGARPLGPDDVPEMLGLVARTRPGPFLPRTIELGGYLGIHRGGRLVAMAGNRMHLDGFTEISAVCTDADVRGQGLARSLVDELMTGIHARGERAFLHAMATNEDAIRLYRSLGFTVRRTLQILATRPAGP
jgi:ribosomal protein S18 acetylase RimI-like enzyme